MVQIRYILYFLGIGVLTWLLTKVEIYAPGSLRLLVYAGPGDAIGTSEYSPVENLQVIVLALCAAMYSWVAVCCPSQRAIAIPFGGLAIIFILRELDYFLDRVIGHGFWQVVAAILGSVLLAYLWQYRRRFRIAWLRIWPSPAMALLFAGAAILFVFVRLMGDELLWQAILGDAYQPVVHRAVEELVEVAGYYFWLIGTVEYAYQARSVAMREPLPAADRRREGRRRGIGF